MTCCGPCFPVTALNAAASLSPGDLQAASRTLQGLAIACRLAADCRSPHDVQAVLSRFSACGAPHVVAVRLQQPDLGQVSAIAASRLERNVERSAMCCTIRVLGSAVI